MPMPWTYRHAGKEWSRFLGDIREAMGTPSDNVAYTAAEGTLSAFRARLTVEQVAGFAQVLPAIPRALFVQGWQLASPRPWADRASYLAEALSLRKNHNFANDRALEAVSYALHRAVGAEALMRALDGIGPQARAFWELDGYAAEDLRAHGF